MSWTRKAIDDFSVLNAGIARDFVSWPERGPRIIDECECVVSVLLAIAAAHLIGVRNVGWAAFSGYMVIRSDFSESLKRGSLRVMGTATGAALAWLLADRIMHSSILLSTALAVVGAVTLYFALIRRSGYAWLFAGLTFSMVLIDGMEHPGEALGVFARSRFIEVSAGTCASVLVSAVSAVSIRRKFLGPGGQSVQEALILKSPLWHKAAFHNAMQGAIALAMIPWVWAWFGIEALSQSSTTILAVMMVPVASLSAAHHPATSKLIHRFIGCSIGGLLATGILMVSHDSPLAMTLAVCIGVIVGRHVENGKLGVAYVGTQFALAFLVVLVPDTYFNVDIQPGLYRLFGIAFGMVLLEPVRLAFRQFRRSRR
ncbi:FUSC family protein [Burkholderia sp. L27(2015)]|uniref:FUSC family protein n=1 Tax=Burkholderia sp. L27(2015) TaxID=1641858 RepID=UPI00131E83C8|nr:FUSC family protein [Burkholderia sp. L27(2015)]